MTCDHKFVDSNACLKCGWSPAPPRQVGRAPIELDLHGMLLPWKGEQPVALQILGGNVAVPLFTTPEKLEATLGAFGIPYERIREIDDSEGFIASMPPEVEIIVDPWKTEDGKVRYLQAMGRLKPA